MAYMTEGCTWDGDGEEGWKRRSESPRVKRFPPVAADVRGVPCACKDALVGVAAVVSMMVVGGPWAQSSVFDARGDGSEGGGGKGGASATVVGGEALDAAA